MDGQEGHSTGTRLVRLEIKRAIREADYVVICLSRHFRGRTYAHKEIRLAIEVMETLPKDRVYLIPARLEECVIDEDLSSRQWVDLHEPDGYDKLLRSMRAVL